MRDDHPWIISLYDIVGHGGISLSRPSLYQRQSSNPSGPENSLRDDDDDYHGSAHNNISSSHNYAADNVYAAKSGTSSCVKGYKIFTLSGPCSGIKNTHIIVSTSDVSLCIPQILNAYSSGQANLINTTQIELF